MAKMTYEEYQQKQWDGGQIAQGIFNAFRNPFGQIGKDDSKGDSWASGQNSFGQSTDMLTNPLGIDFTGGIGGWNKRLAGNKALYEAMSDDDWAAFAKMTTQDQNRFLDQLQKRVDAQAQKDAEAKAKADKEAQFQNWRMDTMKKLDAFAAEMNMSVPELLDRGDVGIRTATRDAVSQSDQAAAAAGVGREGGLGAQNNMRAAMDAQNRYQLQRKEMGLGAYNSLLGQMSGMAHETEDMRRYEQGLDLQMQQAQAAARQQRYLQNQQAAGNTLGMIGGVVGGIYGGAGGAQAGYQLGSGLGQSQYGARNPYSPYEYKYPGQKSNSPTSSGGLGGAQ